MTMIDVNAGLATTRPAGVLQIGPDEFHRIPPASLGCRLRRSFHAKAEASRSIGFQATVRSSLDGPGPLG